MNRGRVFSLSGVKVLENLKTNAYVLICFSFLVLGIFCGLILFDNFSFLEGFFNDFFSQFIKERENSKYLKIVLHSYLKTLLLFLPIFVFGTTIFGVVLVPISMLFYGYFYGAATAFLYSAFALKGVAFNSVIFIPSVILILLFLVFAARHSLEFSLSLAKLTLPDVLGENLFIKFKGYSLSFFLLCLGSLSAALLDGLVSVSLLKFFEL